MTGGEKWNLDQEVLIFNAFNVMDEFLYMVFKKMLTLTQCHFGMKPVLPPSFPIPHRWYQGIDSSWSLVYEIKGDSEIGQTCLYAANTNANCRPEGHRLISASLHPVQKNLETGIAHGLESLILKVFFTQ